MYVLVQEGELGKEGLKAWRLGNVWRRAHGNPRSPPRLFSLDVQSERLPADAAPSCRHALHAECRSTDGRCHIANDRWI